MAMDPETLTIEEADPRDPEVRSVLERHLSFARATTRPEDVHALDPDALLDPALTLFAARLDGAVVGVGALRRLDESHVELKSMHTIEAVRGRGVARALVDHLLAVAAMRGATRASLETGSQEAFAPARALYSSAGFEECGPFGDYDPSRFSTFMTRRI